MTVVPRGAPETEFDEAGKHARRLGRAHAGQSSNGTEVQFSG